MKNPNKCRIIMFLIIMFGICVAGITGIIYGVEPMYPLFVIGIIISVGGLVFDICTVRCPHCKCQLNSHLFSYSEFCPHCGEKITQD